MTTATIDLEEQDVEEYYNGYANRTLWPLFHYRIDLAEYERGFAGGYQRVNERFADTRAAADRERTIIIWVQDYHLLPLGSELRSAASPNRIGFFLHTPWPPRRLLFSLPQPPPPPPRADLARGLFAYDVIGFHTRGMAAILRRFRLSGNGCHGGRRRRAAGRAARDGDLLPDRDRREGVRGAGQRARARLAYRRMRDSAVGRDMIIGVDRLDYSKGLEERFLGYERLLREHPEERKKSSCSRSRRPHGWR